MTTAAATHPSVLDAYIEKVVLALLGVFVGGSYVNWRIGSRVTRVEHALWGVEGEKGIAGRTQVIETAVREVAEGQVSQKATLGAMHDTVLDLRNYLREQRGTP